MKLFQLSTLIFTVFVIAACSNQNAYESIQHSQRMECQKLPPSQVDECLKNTEISYEEYERARQEALKD